MVKLSENTFRDVNIALANELSMLCESAGVNVWEVIQVANRHPRVNILNPGPGVGGHCIAVDPWFLAACNPNESRLIRSAREVNDRKIDWVFERISERAGELKKPVIACLGLSFKADVDDLRESPSADIVRRLIAAEVGEIKAVEPHLESHPEFELYSLQDAVREAQIVVLLTDHTEFKCLRPDILQERVLIDTRGLFLKPAH